MTPYTYWEDTRREALKWAFLGGGSAPLGLDEEDPAIAVMAVVETDEHDGTYEISSR
jgi:hypothetical protein